MALHILVGNYNVVGWWLQLIYISTPPTHHYVESSEQVAYMKTHPILGLLDPILLTIFNKVRTFLHHQVDTRNLENKNLQNIIIILLGFRGPPN